MKSRPKFCVGEEVALESVNRPDLDTPRDEVCSVEWLVVEGWEGWKYQLAGINHPFGWQERSLRKLPPEERTSWETCEFNPTKQGIEA